MTMHEKEASHTKLAIFKKKYTNQTLIFVVLVEEKET